MEGQAQGHDMGVVFAEPERRSMLWQGVKSMRKKSIVNSR